MAKKIVIIMVLAALVAGGAFAQFSFEGGVNTNFSSVTPTLGIAFGHSKFDFLAGLNFTILIDEYDYDNGNTNDYSYTSWSGGIYAGIAPRASLSGNWLLSFPLLAQIRFGGTPQYDYDSSRTLYSGSTSGAGSSSFGFDLRAGSRASYAFSEHWSLYTGFLLNVISWTQTKQNIWKGTTPGAGTELYYTNNYFYFLNSGVVQLGVSYKF